MQTRYTAPMTNRLFSAPIRRTVALALLTIGLHVLAFLLLSPRLRAGAGMHLDKPAVMEARLLAAPPTAAAARRKAAATAPQARSQAAPSRHRRSARPAWRRPPTRRRPPRWNRAKSPPRSIRALRPGSLT